MTTGRAAGDGAGGPAGEGGAGPAGQPAIFVEGLVKSYGGRTVVDGVSLSVAAGELLAVLGPNGAGKTTTVEIIEGYRRADAGRVRVLGSNPATGGPGLRARSHARTALSAPSTVHSGRFHRTRGSELLLWSLGGPEPSRLSGAALRLGCVPHLPPARV